MRTKEEIEVKINDIYKLIRENKLDTARGIIEMLLLGFWVTII